MNELLIQNLLYYLLKSCLYVCRIVPLRLLHVIGYIWGSLLFVFPNRARSTTLANLALCFPSLSEQQLNTLAKKSLKNTACTGLEMGKAWMAPIPKTIALVTEYEGYAEFKEATQSGSGVVLLAPHLSNWEIFGFAACEDVKANFMYKPPKIPAMDRLLKETRSRNNVNLAPANRAGVAQLLKALKAGEMVGILPDQVPELEGGEYAQFFGQTALTMSLASRLIQRTDAKVFCGFAQRLPKGSGFRLIIKPAEDSVYSSDLKESIQGVNDSVQRCVELAPNQYQWEYKRFRRQPDGKEYYRQR
ncbi:MAG: lysophospholipid acyltransferase family protein [Pseudohongiellaceae bacterium]